jgi:hypothetical protein
MGKTSYTVSFLQIFLHIWTNLLHLTGVVESNDRTSIGPPINMFPITGIQSNCDVLDLDEVSLYRGDRGGRDQCAAWALDNDCSSGHISGCRPRWAFKGLSSMQSEAIPSAFWTETCFAQELKYTPT